MKAHFGEQVSNIEFKVLNEREIRAAAGLLFLLVSIAMQRVIYFWDFLMLKYVVTFFFADFLIRIFVSPRYAPSLILGRLFVRNQTPEYVGAEQKRFAWWVGLTLGAIMFISINVLNYHSPITGLICVICAIFLFCESVFGICLGCMAYPWVFRRQPQLCPGEVCLTKDKQEIQKTSPQQLAILGVFLFCFAIISPYLKNHYSLEPILLLGMEKPPQK